MDSPALLLKGCLAMKDLCKWLQDGHQHCPFWPQASADNAAGTPQEGGLFI